MKIDDYLKVIELSKTEAEEVFNQGNFNDIAKAYAVMALINIGADRQQVDAFTNELHRCLDQYTAQEVIQKINKQ